MAGVRGRISGLKHLISFDEAASRLRNGKWRAIRVIEVDVEYALDMVIAESVKSDIDLPSFDRSAVDGFAVRHRDVTGASAERPVPLKVANVSFFGDSPSIGRGMCYEINTGGRLPFGADSVIMSEYITSVGDRIMVEHSTRVWENVSRKGEDISSGTKIIAKGDIIKSWHIAALIAIGRKRIKVFRRIKLGVMATGNEIIQGTKSLVRNTTQPLMLNYFKRGHVETSDEGVYPDDADIIGNAVRKSLGNLDVLVITGGSSIGTHDVTASVLGEIGNEIFRGVMMKPGRTISVYEIEGKPVFSVSGLPVAALTSFEAFFDRFMIDVLGFNDSRQIIRARLTERLINHGGMRSYVRLVLSRKLDSLDATPLRNTGSGILSSLIYSNGVTVVPESVENIDSGDYVWVTLIGGCI